MPGKRRFLVLVALVCSTVERGYLWVKYQIVFLINLCSPRVFDCNQNLLEVLIGYENSAYNTIVNSDLSLCFGVYCLELPSSLENSDTGICRLW